MKGANMPEKTSYDPGEPSWVDLGTPDIDGGASFYRGLFGWDISEPGPVEQTGGYRMASLRGKPVAGLGPQMNPGAPTWTMYVTVEDADRSASIASDAGAAIVVAPVDVLTVGRMVVLIDPVGAAISLWQPGDHTGAGLVNEPGTWCWGELRTPDPDASATFYRRLFGWATEQMPMGNEPYTLFKLGDGTIGGMVKAEGPSVWGISFAVDGTDDAVASARKLDGKVLREPYDLPIGRLADLEDPQGAAFNIITFAAS
jgi:predicted enzyme related to lactoylglutathione lyase